MVKKRTPNVKDKSKKKKPSNPEVEFMEDIRAKVTNDDSDRANWKLKMIASANQRLGVKEVANHPWEDAPNIPLPETDKLIKKATPNFILSAWAPKKLCTVKVEEGVRVTPELKQKAKNAESAMNMILRTKMNLFTKLELASEYFKEKGHCVFRIIEEFKSRQVHKVFELDDYPEKEIKKLKKMTKSDLNQWVADRFDLDLEDDDDKAVVEDVVDQFKSGEDIIEFDVEEISSLPNIEVPLPTRIIVPSYVTDINKSPRVAFEYFLPRHVIEQKMDEEIFIKHDMDEIDKAMVAKGRTDDLVETQKGWNEGVEDNAISEDLYRIREICCWRKLEGEKTYSRWVYTFFAGVYDCELACLQKIPFPFEFEGWQYEKHDNESKDPRYYNSRGTPEQIRAIQEIMERSINNAIIRDELNNNPSYEVVDTSEIWDRYEYFVPGEFLPVKAIGTEIRRLNDPVTMDMSSDRLLQVLKAYAEEYVGSTDQLFRNASNTGGGKTLGEIQEGIKQSSGPLNVEVIRWNETLSRVYTKVFQIMAERLGGSIWIGENEVTREDFNFPAEVRSNGQLDVADSDRATAKAWARLIAVTNPAMAEIVGLEDKYNALRDWLEKDGVKDPDEFSTHPQELLKDKIQQMQKIAQQLAMKIQAMQQQVSEQKKESAKVQKKTKDAVTKAQGEVEATLEEGAVGGPTGQNQTGAG